MNRLNKLINSKNAFQIFLKLFHRLLWRLRKQRHHWSWWLWLISLAEAQTLSLTIRNPVLYLLLKFEDLSWSFVVCGAPHRRFYVSWPTAAKISPCAAYARSWAGRVQNAARCPRPRHYTPLRRQTDTDYSYWFAWRPPKTVPWQNILPNVTLRFTTNTILTENSWKFK